MNSLAGKHLLIISSDSNDIEIVNAAKEMGLYVTCCDRYTDWNISPAKKIADDAWDIDYMNTEKVVKKCIENKVDGVIAGYGEDRVAAACRISSEIGTPFYATEKQIEITRNKRLFKELCNQCGIDTPIEYFNKQKIDAEVINSINYPVIVKPADNGGRKGISVCRTGCQLLDAIKTAFEYSKNGRIIIEEYLQGLELCAVYTLIDGEISLSCLNDKYIAEEQGDVTTLCNLTLTPSKYYKRYIEEVHPKIKEFLKVIGASNGVAYFQFIANNESIKAFEMGYRLNGNNDYKTIDKYNNINYMKMLISYSISGDMGDVIEKDNPLFPRYICTLCVLLKSGIIGKIDYTRLNQLNNIEDVFIWKKNGETIHNTGTNTHKSGMIKFSARTLEEAKKTISFINTNLIIEDEYGNNMLLMPFDIKRLYS